MNPALLKHNIEQIRQLETEEGRVGKIAELLKSGEEISSSEFFRLMTEIFDHSQTPQKDQKDMGLLGAINDQKLRNDIFVLFLKHCKYEDRELEKYTLPQDTTSLEIIECDIKFLPNRLPARLKNLNIASCSQLRYLPTLHDAIESLNITDCNQLTNLLGLLPATLKSLDLTRCSQLTALPDLPATLKNLNLTGCSQLTNLPTLPDALESLNLTDCNQLTNLLGLLPATLKSLDLTRCSRLTDLPNLPATLKNLNLTGCSQLTDLLGLLPATLKSLDLTRCSQLTALPALPATLESLDLAGCSQLTALPDLPATLKNLNLARCSALRYLPTLPHALKSLNLRGHFSPINLLALPNTIEALNLSGCNLSKGLPTLPNNLKMLHLTDSLELTTLEDLPNTIETLNLSGCSQLKSLAHLPTELESLFLKNCYRLRTLPTLHPKLEYIDLTKCSQLTDLPALPATLRDLDLTGCSQLKALPALPATLKYLDLTGCTSLPNNQDTIDKLRALEEANRDNPQFMLKLPIHISTESEYTKTMQTVFRANNLTFLEENSEENSKKINDTAQYPLLKLFYRYLKDNSEARGGLKFITERGLAVARIIEKNPAMIPHLNTIAQNYLEACVNRPVAGFFFIAACAEIYNAKNFNKIEAAKILATLIILERSVKTIVGAHDGRGANVEVELFNALAMKVCNELGLESLGVPMNVAHIGTVESQLDQNTQKLTEEIREVLKDKKEIANILCEGPFQDFWADTLIADEDLLPMRVGVDRIKESILELTNRDDDPEKREKEELILSEQLNIAEYRFREDKLSLARSLTAQIIRENEGISVTHAAQAFVQRAHTKGSVVQ